MFNNVAAMGKAFKLSWLSLLICSSYRKVEDESEDLKAKLSLVASCTTLHPLLHSQPTLTPSQNMIELVKEAYAKELGQTIDDEQAEDFIRRSQQLLEWLTEVTSKGGFEWPEGFDPQACGLKEA